MPRRRIPRGGTHPQEKVNSDIEIEITSTSADSRAELCRKCRRIGRFIKETLSTHARNPNPKRFSPWPGQVYSLRYIDPQSSCPLCLFFYLARTRPDDSAAPEPAYSLHVLSAKAELDIWETDLNDSPAFAVLPVGYLSKWSWDQHEAEWSGLILPHRDDPDTVSARRLQPSIDTSLIRQWLNFCDANHNALCHKTYVPPPPGFRVIDCSARRLITWESINTPAHYLTLSYVWGGVESTNKTPNNNDTLPPNLPPNLPQTIQDTITLTLQLGYRYLWIDRYCIPQNEPLTKQSQIQAMDSIYRGSSLTIIAAAGTNPHHGLPGITTTTPRTPQPTISLPPSHTLLFSPLAKRAILDSPWQTRGWTYQEGLLARRKLVFSPSTTYFQCPRMHALESIHVPPSAVPEFSDEALPPRASVSQRFFPVNSIGENQLELDRRVGEYLRRKFTYESDMLDAFRGVLAAFERAFGCRSLCGLTVYSPGRFKRGAVLSSLWDGIVPLVEVGVEFADGLEVAWGVDTAEGVLERDKRGDSPRFLVVEGLTLRVRISRGGRVEATDGEDGEGIVQVMTRFYTDGEIRIRSIAYVWSAYGMPEQTEAVEFTLVVLARSPEGGIYNGPMGLSTLNG
ncbi:tol protein [Podospora aff. communis PSN243]|uniref:Tol protein n=1 Tax=Podospora aff. communis PSN243 TaxID=3040156 RepID=A0AAV9GHR5_9PEZI|nr:tol protein [Podospora aff. communis PSN243]